MSAWGPAKKELPDRALSAATFRLAAALSTAALAFAAGPWEPWL